MYLEVDSTTEFEGMRSNYKLLNLKLRTRTSSLNKGEGAMS